MLTLIFVGYLAASTLTFLFIYSSYIVGARADELQEMNGE